MQQQNTKNNTESQLAIRLFAIMADSINKDLQARHMFGICLKETGDKVQLKEKERTAPVSVLNDIFKDFAKEQFKENNESANTIEYDYIKAESLEYNKKWFKQNKIDIKSGKPEKLLKHLGIVKDGLVNLDSLETAIKTARLLLDFSENHEDRLFILPGLEIQAEQLYRLHRIVRGL